jgi:hypothetical protein
MLERLEFKHLGPSPAFGFRFGSRLNILTGDNGLGKTFVLDAAWWALTRTWADDRALTPDVDSEDEPVISYHVHGVGGANKMVSCKYDFELLDWKLPQRRPPIPGLVIYARIDGGFSIWDPARNYWRESEHAPVVSATRPSAYQFNRKQIWWGLWRTAKDELERNKGAQICRGLVEDLETWRLEKNEAYALFGEVLEELSPHGDEPLVLAPGSVKVGDEPWKTPTLQMPYTPHPVPITQTSAGIRRVLALAYALVWAWTEHLAALKRHRGHVTQAGRIVLLFDEVEAHLHPQWQRVLLPALLRAVKSKLLQGTNTPVQIIATTHAPLVLASVEPHFDEKTDKLFSFELRDGVVTLEQARWAKQGDALNWLVSETFGLKQARSLEAERAIEAAEAWMRGDLAVLPQGLKSARTIDAELRRVLAGHDIFWPRWTLKSGLYGNGGGA